MAFGLLAVDPRSLLATFDAARAAASRASHAGRVPGARTISGMEPDTYLTIDAACARFGLSRRTFYRMLADRRSGLLKVVVRIPPGTGRIRVPANGFEQWLLERQ